MFLALTVTLYTVLAAKPANQQSKGLDTSLIKKRNKCCLKCKPSELICILQFEAGLINIAHTIL